jgi:hypothetical protein
LGLGELRRGHFEVLLDFDNINAAASAIWMLSEVIS